MNICDMVTGTKRLQKATKMLKETWLRTKEHWRDKTAEQFEEKYLEPLGERIHLALAAVDSLTEVLDQAENELSNREAN